MGIRKVKDTVTPKLKRAPSEIDRVKRGLLIGFMRDLTDESRESRHWVSGKPAMRAGLNRRKHAVPPKPAPIRGKLTSRHGLAGLRGSATFTITRDGGLAYLFSKDRTHQSKTSQAKYGGILAAKNPQWNFLLRALRYAWNKALPKFKKKFDEVVKK